MPSGTEIQNYAVITGSVQNGKNSRIGYGTVIGSFPHLGQVQLIGVVAAVSEGQGFVLVGLGRSNGELILHLNAGAPR